LLATEAIDDEMDGRVFIGACSFDLTPCPGGPIVRTLADEGEERMPSIAGASCGYGRLGGGPDGGETLRICVAWIVGPPRSGNSSEAADMYDEEETLREAGSTIVPSRLGELRR
jgi:hypothetical protein